MARMAVVVVLSAAAFVLVCGTAALRSLVRHPGAPPRSARAGLARATPVRITCLAARGGDCWCPRRRSSHVPLVRTVRHAGANSGHADRDGALWAGAPRPSRVESGSRAVGHATADAAVAGGGARHSGPRRAGSPRTRSTTSSRPLRSSGIRRPVLFMSVARPPGVLRGRDARDDPARARTYRGARQRTPPGASRVP